MEVEAPVEDEPAVGEEEPSPRRSSRRLALTEMNAAQQQQATMTPQKTSPAEMVIVLRGPRRKPLVWSPVEYGKNKVLGPPREVTPEKRKSAGKPPDLNPKLRRRLALSPSKGCTCTLGQVIAKKLKSLPKYEEKL